MVFNLKPAENHPCGALFREAEQGRVRDVLVDALNRLGRDRDSTDTQSAVRQLWRLGVRRIYRRFDRGEGYAAVAQYCLR
jgi:hypothetical protein